MRTFTPTKAIKTISTSRCGNGAYFSSNHTTWKEATNLIGYYFKAERPSIHATMIIEYLDGTKDYFDNNKEKVIFE